MLVMERETDDPVLERDPEEPVTEWLARCLQAKDSMFRERLRTLREPGHLVLNFVEANLAEIGRDAAVVPAPPVQLPTELSEYLNAMEFPDFTLSETDVRVLRTHPVLVSIHEEFLSDVANLDNCESQLCTQKRDVCHRLFPTCSEAFVVAKENSVVLRMNELRLDLQREYEKVLVREVWDILEHVLKTGMSSEQRYILFSWLIDNAGKAALTPKVAMNLANETGLSTDTITAWYSHATHQSS
eukprot:Rmarinus@m.23466